MANKNKAKGTKAETAVAKFLNARGWKARRQALSGKEDKGDLEVIDPDNGQRYTFEVKAGKQTFNPNRSKLKKWMMQARVEAYNNDTDYWYLVVVRYQRSIKDADVYTGDVNDSIVEHMWLDEFKDCYK